MPYGSPFDALDITVEEIEEIEIECSVLEEFDDEENELDDVFYF